MPQGEFISPEEVKSKKGSRAACRVGNGGKELLKLDDALAAVDDFVSEKIR